MRHPVLRGGPADGRLLYVPDKGPDGICVSLDCHWHHYVPRPDGDYHPPVPSTAGIAA